MRASRPRSIGAGGLLGLLLAGCAPPSAMASRTDLPAGTSAWAEAIEAEVHHRVNRHRAARGLPALSLDERVSAVARRHSQAMAGHRARFGHDGFDQRAARVSGLFEVRALAENVAYDGRPRTAARAVNGWISSAGHRANLEGDFHVTGIGAARARDGTVYLTQIFVAHR